MLKVMTDDMTLLREYARRNSEEAFAALVSRHVNLVYSVALRDVRDPQLAEEITQVVFIVLARKAASLGANVILSGWLCRTARYAGANALKMQRRRQQREQEAYMQSTMNQSESEAEAWIQIAPLLGGAMEQLGQKDHDAVVLRFFEGKSFQEIGTAFGASENAAKKRVAYALEKLRKYFSKRGVVLPAAVIIAALSANSVHAAPAVLAKAATAVAIAKGAAATGSTLTLIKGALKLMAWTKAKLAIFTGVAVLLAVGGGTAIYETQRNPAAGDPVAMRVKWVVGKKYELHGESNHSEATKSPGQPQPAPTGYKWTQDMNISAVKALPEGGWQLELEISNEALDESQGGRNGLSFDSAQSRAVNKQNPLTILGALIGARLEYFTDADGKVQTVEGMDKLTNHIAAIGTPEQRQLFDGLFGGDQLKGYLSTGDWLANRTIKVGESWAVKNDGAYDVGVVTISMKYTFKNWEQHDDHKCAHILGAGSLSIKSASAASGKLVEIENGKLSEEFWFDPELGMIVGGNESQDLTCRITTRTQTSTDEVRNQSRWTLAVQ